MARAWRLPAPLLAQCARRPARTAAAQTSLRRPSSTVREPGLRSLAPGSLVPSRQIRAERPHEKAFTDGCLCVWKLSACKATSQHQRVDPVKAHEHNMRLIRALAKCGMDHAPGAHAGCTGSGTP